MKLLLAIMFCVALGCATKKKPYVRYDMICAECGKEFRIRTNKGDPGLSLCYECSHPPLDVCSEAAMLMINIGSQNEIVRAQPENEEAKALLDAMTEKLVKHLKTCEKCRKALDAR